MGRKVLWKTFYFDAAHSLPVYLGPCHCLHGHRWRLDVGITGNVEYSGSCRGMIIDFVELKKLMAPIIDKLDHHYLNDFIDNPTAETIIDFLLEELSFLLPDHLTLYGLNLYETPDSCVEWRDK